MTVEEIPEDMAQSCLFSLSVDDIISESIKAMKIWAEPLEEKIELEKNDPSNMGYRMWVVVDDYADQPFMPTHPITVLHNQQQKMVPFMTGVTTEEGALLAPGLWKDMDPANNVVEKNWDFIGAKNLFPGQREFTFDDALKAKMVAHFYLGKDGLKRENKQGLMDMFTDVFFAAPNTEAVRLHAKAPAPVYNYLFSYKGSFSFASFYAAGHPEASKEVKTVNNVKSLGAFFPTGLGRGSRGRRDVFEQDVVEGAADGPVRGGQEDGRHLQEADHQLHQVRIC